MCDPTPLRNWLLAIAAAIATAIGLIITAAITNGSFFLAWQSWGWMLLAAGATGGAILLCGQARTELETLDRCTGERCAGECKNMRNVLDGARVVLGIQASACLATATYAWIPWAAQPSMWVIVAALTVQAALIASAIAFFKNLAACCLKINIPQGGDLRIMYVEEAMYSDTDRRIASVGGIANGQYWQLSLDQAIQAIESGFVFYVEQPAGDRVNVVIARSQRGKRYLKTVADGDEPNNLLALPECPPRSR